MAHAFLAGLLALGLPALPRVKRLISSDRFSVDGTLIDAWASMKGFRPKDGSGSPPGPGRNGERDFRTEDAFQRDPCLDDRSGRPALPQGGRP